MADAPVYCSFCGKCSNEVKKLIAGPTVFICDECVALCSCIIVSEMEANRFGIWHLSKAPPMDSTAIIKAIVRELREEEAQGTSGSAQDRNGLDPKDAGPVGNADAPQGQSHD